MGFNIKLSFAGQNILKKKHFGLFFTEGVDFGRLKIVNTRNEKLKNSLFAPFAGLVMRVSVSRFKLFAFTQFEYDLSAKNWKKLWFAKKQENEIPHFNQNGIVFSVGINYSLNKLYTK